MRNPLRIFLPLLALLSLSFATSLTYDFAPNEKACFYAHVSEAGLKVSFYFAVQSGGSFDINWEIVGPRDKIIDGGEGDRQGDYVFTANEVGEYRFCFDNEMSTLTDKSVDFEIAVENEQSQASIPSKKVAPAEQTSQVSESIIKINGQLNTINRNQKYFRTRENRNFSTVRSTEGRIFKFSIIENVVMVSMAGLQVFIVRFFFTGGRKGV